MNSAQHATPSRTRTAAVATRRGAVRLLSALGLVGALLARGDGVGARKDKKNKKKDRRCKRDRKALKQCRSAVFCPERGCCRCQETATEPQRCATFPNDTLDDDCVDFCGGGRATFPASPTDAFANFCDIADECVRIACPVV